jgi:hypothetical protein
LYNAWYQGPGADAEQRRPEFLLGGDLHEELVWRGDWTVGPDSYRRRMQRRGGRPARRRGRPRKPPPGQEGFSPNSMQRQKMRKLSLRQAKLRKGGGDVASLKPFVATLWVTNPTRQGLASHRKRVLRRRHRKGADEA